MTTFGKLGLAAASLLAFAAFEQGNQVVTAGGPIPVSNGPFQVLAPIRER